MVHIGEAEFYARVYADAGAHDVMLMEGVRSPVTRVVTSSYRWINLKKLGLVLQRNPSPGGTTARIVHADLSRQEFETEWRRVPLWLRLAVLCLAPLMGLRRRMGMTREQIAEVAEMEDLRSADELISWDPKWAALKKCVVAARDVRLIEKLTEELDHPAEEGERRIAVVYGAGHMRAVLGELRKRGFRGAESVWMTIFAY